MKKLIALLLAAVMCLSLAACGSKKEAPESESSEAESKEQVVELTMDNWPESESSETESKEQVVELTMDNWQDFFEFRISPEPFFNVFDEFDDVEIKAALFLKDDVADKVQEINDVAFEYNLTDSYSCWYEYDIETNTLIQKEAASDDSFVGRTWNYQLSIGNIDLNELKSKEGLFFTSPEFKLEKEINGNTLSFISIAFETMEITRIKGTVTLVG